MNLAESITQKFLANNNIKILFFFDDNQKHKEDLFVADLGSIVLLEADDKYFTLKYKLEIELQNQNVLLYFPYSKPTDDTWDSFPLLDLYYANEELLVDDVGQFLDNYHLASHHKSLISRYIDELNVKKNSDRIVSILNNDELSEHKLQHALIAAFLELDAHVSSNLCIIKTFTYLTIDKKLDLFMSKIKKYPDLEKEFLQWLISKFPCEKRIKTFDKDSIILSANILKYNLMLPYATKTDKHDNYKDLKITGEAESNNLISMSKEWQDNKNLASHFTTVMEEVCATIKVEHLIDIYGSDKINFFKSGSGIKAALKDIFTTLILSPEKSLNKTEKLMTEGSSDKNTQIVNFLYYTSKLFILLQQKRDYVLNSESQYINNYTKKDFKIDQLYRKVILYRNKISDSIHELGISLDQIDDEINSLYDNHIKNQNIEWQKLLREKDFAINKIYNAKLQFNFYNDYIKGLKNKIVVIISDALRYEIAEELYQKLSEDSKNKIELDTMLSTIPSFTKLGMASLLPNDGICIKESDSVFDLTIQNIATNSTENRRLILQLANESSDAFLAANIPSKREDWTKQYGDKQVVYIYHNVIDATGDDRKTESMTFDFVEVAINDLKDIIKKLTNFNVSNIIITSDHGFLFTMNRLQEPSKEDLPKSDNNLIEHNRFIITKDKKLKHEGYQFPLSNTTNIKTDLQVVLPRAINRFRKSGSGDQFVHGGSSLQEVIIPVLKYSRMRMQQKNPVEVKLLTDKLKIVSNVLKCNILQENPVNDEYEKRILDVGLFNEKNEQLSYDLTITLISNSEKAPDREQSLQVTLKEGKGKENKCFLKIYDKINDKNHLNPLVNIEVQNTTLIESDF